MPFKNSARKKAYHKKYDAQPARVAARLAWQRNNPDKIVVYKTRWRTKNPRNALLVQTRFNAKRHNLEFSITEKDLSWPTHCPVLKLELVYVSTRGKNLDYAATIDRHDNTKGYVPGNVFVISARANRVKNDATPSELVAIAAYAAAPPLS